MRMIVTVKDDYEVDHEYDNEKEDENESLPHRLRRQGGPCNLVFPIR